LQERVKSSEAETGVEKLAHQKISTSNMRILIIGASGLIGSNCLRYFRQQGHDVLGTYFSYKTEDTVFLDTLNPDNAENANLDGFKPNVILNCGALTHVDYCEQNPQESLDKTVKAHQTVLAWASKYNAKVVYISTDYVFDGKEGPYKETDEVNPISVYGAHKLQAEKLTEEHSAENLILRVTNVYGDEERGKNFIARIIQQAKDGQKLTLNLPIDQYATPVNGWDVARALLLLLEDNKSGIYNIASTDFLNRVELALKVLNYFPNAEYELNPKTTEELKQPALRPLIGGLITAKFSSEYPTFLFSSVDGYLRGNNHLGTQGTKF
jgi:dTDP-4-dehydrorhamnose reductase